MDYAEILIRIDEQRKAAQKAFLSKNVGRAEVCALEFIRLGVKLLDEAEALTNKAALNDLGQHTQHRQRLTRPMNDREKSALGPHPGDYGIPKEHWDAVKSYRAIALLYMQNKHAAEELAINKVEK